MATVASAAVPPASKIFEPIAEATGSLEAQIPRRLNTGDLRLFHESMVTLSRIISLVVFHSPTRSICCDHLKQKAPTLRNRSSRLSPKKSNGHFIFNTSSRALLHNIAQYTIDSVSKMSKESVSTPVGKKKHSGCADELCAVCLSPFLGTDGTSPTTPAKGPMVETKCKVLEQEICIESF